MSFRVRGSEIGGWNRSASTRAVHLRLLLCIVLACTTAARGLADEGFFTDN
jgi:hypothetical protein